MKNISFLLTVLLSGALLLHSCKKSEDAKADEALVSTAEELASNEDFSEQIDLDADLAVEERGGGGTLCPSVTFAQPWGNWPNTVTIDFGASCEYPENSGRVHRGKIIFTQSASAFTPGAVRTMTFDGYAVEGVQIQGSKTWTNNGLNANFQWSFTKTANNMVLTYPDGTTTSWNLSHTTTLTEGGVTPTIWDNVWSTVGNASGTNRLGETFSATITSPLLKNAFCRWISEGEIELSKGTRSGSLNFGDGSCDSQAKLTLDNGGTFSIQMGW